METFQKGEYLGLLLDAGKEAQNTGSQCTGNEKVCRVLSMYFKTQAMFPKRQESSHTCWD